VRDAAQRDLSSSPQRLVDCPIASARTNSVAALCRAFAPRSSMAVR
jgi:hypothetical protein